LPRKRIKVLYACPFAHYSGHPPSVTIHETAALARAGVDVTLLTFYGIIDKTKVKVPHIRVLKQMRVKTQLLLNRFLTRPALLRWPIMVLENFWTVAVAIRLKRKLNYDIILLRDGDPFLFVPFLLSLPLRNYNWAVFLNGGIVLPKPPIGTSLFKNWRMFVYTLVLKAINSKLWKPIYRKSMARNHFIFPIPSNSISQIYSSYMQGIFSGRTICMESAVGSMVKAIPKQDARRRLGLPQDKPLFLSFGVPHPAKDVETVFRALNDIPDVFLIQAGMAAYSVGQNPTKLAGKYDMRDKVIIRDHYIPEEEKPYYFHAADAVILSYTKQLASATGLLWEACLYAPVIASDNGEQGEIVRAFQLGLLFKAQDVDSLREAVIRFISLKTEEIESMKENCRKFSEQFSIDKMAENLLEVFASMLENKSGNPEL
jgi:glycosyltransferase involved in cell wall biosynthesis